METVVLSPATKQSNGVYKMTTPDYTFTKDFEWWDDKGNYCPVTVVFGVEKDEYWDEDSHFLYHTVTPITADWETDLMGFLVMGEANVRSKFGDKQVNEWIEYTEELLDELYGVIEG